MGRERSVWSRANLELARGEVARPGPEMWGGVPFPVPLVAVALRAVLEIDLFAGLPLRLSSDVLGRHRRPGHRGKERGSQDRGTSPRDRASGHFVPASSLARG